MDFSILKTPNTRNTKKSCTYIDIVLVNQSALTDFDGVRTYPVSFSDHNIIVCDYSKKTTRKETTVSSRTFSSSSIAKYCDSISHLDLESLETIDKNIVHY